MVDATTEVTSVKGTLTIRPPTLHSAYAAIRPALFVLATFRLMRQFTTATLRHLYEMSRDLTSTRAKSVRSVACVKKNVLIFTGSDNIINTYKLKQKLPAILGSIVILHIYIKKQVFRH
jgi:hypothetical protein